VLTQPKAITDKDAIALMLSEAAWDEHIIPPAQPIAELQGVSAHLSSSSIRVNLTLIHSFAGSFFLWLFSNGTF
jgi:hypothetical protein